jgi:hypothetical protein
MAFKPLKQNVFQDVKSALIDNSQTLAIGEVIVPGVQGGKSVVLTGGGTTGQLLGVVVGFKDRAGHAIELNTVVAEADNVTDKLIRAVYIPAHLPIEWETDLDAAAETTAGSGTFAKFAVDATGLLADESSEAVYTVVEDKQLFSYGLTGKNTTQITVSIVATMLGYNIA